MSVRPCTEKRNEVQSSLPPCPKPHPPVDPKNAQVPAKKVGVEPSTWQKAKSLIWNLGQEFIATIERRPWQPKRF
jgi:hypothetical protein